MATTTIGTTLEGDTLARLCARELGTTAGGIVEQALALNPGLADLGVILPPMTDVILPVPAAASSTPATLDIVQLWT
jgi:phage tail protein X